MNSSQAIEEAERCLYCFDAPCVEQCPAHIDIPTYIAMIRTGNTIGAAQVIKRSNALANICGQVCPEEIYCQSVCNRTKQDTPIKIRELHYFATQHEARTGFTPISAPDDNEKKVAVIGGGPAGLGCAFELAKLGYAVTVFDMQGAGGVPKNSIPGFRLSDPTFEDDINFISEHVVFRKEYVSPNRFTAIRRMFDAVFIGIGLGKDRISAVPGETLGGVYSALEFLEEAKQRKKDLRVGKSVVVIGGGNVSLDCAATSKVMGAESVILLYRRGPEEMKVWKTELEEARSRGVEIRFLTSPVEIQGTKKVTGVLCRRNELSTKRDASGRPKPVAIPDSEFLLPADTVVVAIGQEIASPLAGLFKRLPSGYIGIDNQFKTSLPGVFAGGDCVSGEGTIVLSLAHGKSAAAGIHRHLSPSGRQPSGPRTAKPSSPPPTRTSGGKRHAR